VHRSEHKANCVPMSGIHSPMPMSVSLFDGLGHLNFGCVSAQNP